MNLEGGLIIDVHWNGQSIDEVDLTSVRPLQLVQLLRGKTATEGIKLLGMMYRVCGVAQRFAGLSAWRRTCDVTVPEAFQRAQQLLLKTESLREHLWQVLVVWPKLLGETPKQNPSLLLLSRMVSEVEQALFAKGLSMTPAASLAIQSEILRQILQDVQLLVEDQISGIPMEQWLAMNSASDLFEWSKQVSGPAARMIAYIKKQEYFSLGNNSEKEIKSLPMLAEDRLIEKFTTDSCEEFVTQPLWQGQCFETGVFSRQSNQTLVSAAEKAYGKGLLVRILARLVELLLLMKEIKQGAEDLTGLANITAPLPADSRQTGQGLAMIEAARGRLIHWMELEQGVISDYAIVAPTEWNFHPQGIAAAGIKNLYASDEQQLKHQIALWINAIDPCVGYELRIH